MIKIKAKILIIIMISKVINNNNDDDIKRLNHNHNKGEK